MNCDRCGSELKSGAAFCTHCGQKVAQKKFCPFCGCEMPAASGFCPGCGRSVSGGGAGAAARPAVPRPATVPGGRSRKKGLIIGLSAAAAALVLTLVLILTLGGGYEKTINKFFRGINNSDASAIRSTLAPGTYFRSDFEDASEYSLFGSMSGLADVELKYDIEDAEKLRGSELSDAWKNCLDDYYSASPSEGYIVYITLTMDMGKLADAYDYF